MKAWIPASATSRLLLALAASVIAHMTLVLLPYAGGAGQGARLDADGPRVSRGMQYRIVATQAAEAAPVPANRDAATEARDASPAPAARSHDGGPLPIPAATFYSSDQLTKRPVLLGDDPLDAAQLSVLASSGRLMMKLWINDRGQVIEAETEKSELPQEFAAAAAAAFKQVRFAPGERAGLPVGSIIRIEVRYTDTRKSS